MKSVSRYEALKPNPTKAGYSDIRLWPCYGVFSAAILLTAPILGLFTSSLLFGTIAYFTAKKALKIQKANGNFHTFNPQMLVLEWELKHQQPKPTTKSPIEPKELQTIFPRKNTFLRQVQINQLFHSHM